MKPINEFQNKLKKKFDNVMNGWNTKKQYAYANTIMLLRDWCLEQLVETEKTHLLIERKQLVKKYRKLCETRIHNVADDWVAFFIEELTDSEPEELLGDEKCQDMVNIDQNGI